MATEAALPTVTVAEVASGEVVTEVAISGSLVPGDEVLVYPQITGFAIQSIEAEIGDVVSSNALLAKLATATLEAQFAQAQAELRRTEASLRQAKSQVDSATASLDQTENALSRGDVLRSSGTISQAAQDENTSAALAARASLTSARDGVAVAEAQVEKAQSQSAVAELNLALANIRAPVSGTISRRTAKIGAIAGSGPEPLFTLITDGIIEVEAEVIETELGRVAPGNDVNLAVAGLGQMAGTVRLVAPVVDPITRLGMVRITLPSNPGLREGLFASGLIVTDQRMALTVPASAILSEGDSYLVLVVKNGEIERRPVRAGVFWNDAREVIDGLVAGEFVVAKAGAFFRDGDRVNTVVTASMEAQP